MTLNDLKLVLAELPEDIPVSRYKALNEEFPRVVWNETNLEQTYSSNEARDLTVRVVVEFLARPADADRFLDVVRLFRRKRIPFTAACGVDEDNEVVSYEFSIMINETFSDEIDEDMTDDE